VEKTTFKLLLQLRRTKIIKTKTQLYETFFKKIPFFVNGFITIHFAFFKHFYTFSFKLIRSRWKEDFGRKNKTRQQLRRIKYSTEIDNFCRAKSRFEFISK
jgi:hypothetical protein